jgi:hypothetical protein
MRSVFILLSLAVALVGVTCTAAVQADEKSPLAKAPLKPQQTKEMQQQWAKHLGKPPIGDSLHYANL